MDLHSSQDTSAKIAHYRSVGKLTVEGCVEPRHTLRHR